MAWKRATSTIEILSFCVPLKKGRRLGLDDIRASKCSFLVEILTKNVYYIDSTVSFDEELPSLLLIKYIL